MAVYRAARAKGFTNAAIFEDAQRRGFTTASDSSEAIRVNIIWFIEYAPYKALKEELDGIRLKYRHGSCTPPS